MPVAIIPPYLILVLYPKALIHILFYFESALNIFSSFIYNPFALPSHFLLLNIFFKFCLFLEYACCIFIKI